MSACAGVALVKAHAPFHRSYELAEELCRSAKSARQKTNELCGVETESWLDWHVGSVRPGETIKATRKQQYKDDSLTMRPYPLLKYNNRSQTWDWLDREILGPGKPDNHTFRGDLSDDGQAITDNKWPKSRSRVKHLAMLVVNDKEALVR